MTNQTAIETTTDLLRQLEALLAALTGSAGTDELNSTQIDAALSTCHRLAFDALQSLVS